MTGNAEELVPRVASEAKVHTFIIDPPRKGSSESVLKTLIKSKPEQIIYISCNPSTLARDLERLESYHIHDLRIVDMFPQTQHIETAVLLRPNRTD